MNAQVARVKDIGNRNAAVLENGQVRVMVSDRGGMVPELSTRRGSGYLNAHWTPRFRSNSGDRFDPNAHGDFWPVNLLYELAGNFPCFPNFGPPCTVGKTELPAHGETANLEWESVETGVVPGGAAFQRSALKPSTGLPFEYTKTDAVFPNQPIHYCALTMRNTGTESLAVNGAWHNTVGPPFLSEGCLIDVAADRFAVPPAGGEFDETTRLAVGSEFRSLDSAPLADGGIASLRHVPGMIGYTDFVLGAVPAENRLGWSAVVNPRASAAYLCFFLGPDRAREQGLVPLNFNALWMQYGGRNFPPWASYDGGTDMTFCLGTENATGAYAYGLEYALEHRELLGASTVFVVAPGETKTLYYGTAFFLFEGGELSFGVSSVEPENGGLSILGRPGAGKLSTVFLSADYEFEQLAKLHNM